ncbi:MAG: serine/threonine-protein kinase, partial [Nannocystaceae bacterium]
MSSEALTQPTAPQAPALELERLRSSVKARLFQKTEEPLRIGRFRVLRCIGQGGMGMVFAARDDELQRTVAIKLLRPELSNARLTDEAQALARLSHPNVVGIYDVGVHDDQRFIAMEFVDGCTLGTWLRSGPTLDQILEVFIAAGRGLAAAHQVGLVHRDFKPDNVLVGRDGRPRILDFGLARPPDRAPLAGLKAVPALPDGCDAEETAMTREGMLLGTPAYMAPEQHLGEPADARSDQFSFAVALYEAVYGSRPFRGEDIRTLSLAIVRGTLQRPPNPRVEVPAWLDALLLRTLRVAPESRLPSMEVLVELLVARRGDPVRSARRQTSVKLGFDDTLSLEDVRDVADQVGLAESDARIALGKSNPETARPQTHSTGLLLAPAPHYRMATAASTSIDLSDRPSPNTMVLMAQELEIAEGRRGKGQTQFIGESLAWTSKNLDLRVLPRARGATILLVRDL